MPATISTLGQLISLIYLVFDYLGWGPTELGAQGGRPACPPPGPALLSIYSWLYILSLRKPLTNTDER